MANTNICLCGCTSDAVDRAMGLYKKMLGDNECPLFATAVGHALSCLAARGVGSMLDKDGTPINTLTNRLEVDINQRHVTEKVFAYMQSDYKRLNVQVDALFDDMYRRMEKDDESKLKDPPDPNIRKGD